ncbi:MAG TPA: hypothetical protein VGT07_09190 [Steroidobacteraceae bacterium]|nr:hypothetical protein [Bryobacteraceae bacterium]HEV2442686.1 hypothetical protein [Steroidobacteraceae bacterium]
MFSTWVAYGGFARGTVRRAGRRDHGHLVDDGRCGGTIAAAESPEPARAVADEIDDRQPHGQPCHPPRHAKRIRKFIAVESAPTPFGPWNPGIHSQVPHDLRQLTTIFRSENVFTSITDVEELRDLTGLELRELVCFRPQRLALHELLVRVTADFSVPDGSSVEDLGINFRRIARVLLARYIDPQLSAITATFEASKQRLSGLIDSELAAMFCAPAVADVPHPQRPRFLGGLLRRRGRRPETKPVSREPDLERQTRLIAAWEGKAATGRDRPEEAAYRALAKVVSALIVRHSGARGSRELIASLVTNIACNDFGGEEIGRLIEPWLIQAATREGYNLLPRQEQPVVMNTKGPSASGKSTIRPLQKALAAEIGVRWSEFALVSPDIWRKQLLDYSTLGSAYKYGAAFTADEVHLIDKKLDRYMARKARRGDMSHLLIDRFRFDSFAPDSDEAGSNLLTRFGHIVYLFFMITPPASLVERAWKRGLEVGRYKAVDDTLAHCVEAYSGMPHLFFTWVQRTDKLLHFEFLDNSVPPGQRPRTVAFGSNEVMNVLDVTGLLDVERFRRVNVEATAPELLYQDTALLAPERNTAFLRQCAARFREINFADQATGRIFLRLVSGKPVWLDCEVLAQAACEPDVRAGLMAVAPQAFDQTESAERQPRYLQESGADRTLTLGRWADRGSAA